MEDSNNGSEKEPQDVSVPSEDMTDAETPREEYLAKSVYDGLVRIGRCRGKLYGTGGRRANMMRFDLTSHCVFAGNCCLLRRGELLKRELETSSVKVTFPEGIPWLTCDERNCDPETLYDTHYLSRPNGSEKFMHSNFPAKDVDEMSDDELTAGVPRDEARIRLEAWVLCAALDGTLEGYVTGKPNWKPGSIWWSRHDKGNEHELVIRTEWWRKAPPRKMQLSAMKDGGGYKYALWCGNTRVAVFGHGIDQEDMRTLQSAYELRQALSSLADSVFRMQVRVKQYDCDPVLNEVSRILKYIERGAD